jgi:hypothetical protein
MAEAFRNTAESLARLKRAWRACSFDAKCDLFWSAVGLFLMSSAVVLEFGRYGALFLLGFLTWKGFSR